MNEEMDREQADRTWMLLQELFPCKSSEEKLAEVNSVLKELEAADQLEKDLNKKERLGC